MPKQTNSGRDRVSCSRYWYCGNVQKQIRNDTEVHCRWTAKLSGDVARKLTFRRKHETNWTRKLAAIFLSILTKDTQNNYSCCVIQLGALRLLEICGLRPHEQVSGVRTVCAMAGRELHCEIQIINSQQTSLLTY